MPNVDPRIVWRVMLGVECLPIALFMALLATIPESPRWLVRAVFFMPETKGGTIEDIEERLGVE